MVRVGSGQQRPQHMCCCACVVGWIWE